MNNIALFVRADSAYKKRKNWDVFDVDRDALSYSGDKPVVCHPPCRTWSNLSHLASRAIPNESDLALWSVKKIRDNGGILEHPAASKLFGNHLPDVDSGDIFGGFTILIDQYDFGHVAHKKTKLYFWGIDFNQLPCLPEKDRALHYCDKGKLRSIAGNVKGTVRCTQYQREYTPDKLIDYFEVVLDIIRHNKNEREK
jgi:hypothetical protein